MFDGLYLGPAVTSDDLVRIEAALGITLPESYRKVALSYPVPSFAGNADTQVWDSAKRLIEFNLELRAGAPGGVKPWPTTMFATGHGGDGCPTALDLSAGDAVWWVDHCHLDNPSSYREADAFGPWAEKYFKDLREDLAGDGIDPDGTPDERTLAQSGNDKYFFGCVIVLLLVVGAVIAMRVLAR